MPTSRSRRLLGGALLLLATSAVLIWAVRALGPETVTTVTLETRDVRRTLVVLGQIRTPSRAGLGSAVAGVVAEVRAEEGDRVNAGEAVVLLVDREERAAVAQAEAALAQVRVTLAADVEQAQREVSQLEREAERLRAVHAVGGIPLQQLEQAERAVADARTRLGALRASAGSADENVNVAQSRAALDAARARLDLTRIVAPADGTVLARQVEPGDAVQPGRVLLEIAADGPTEIVAFPAEENLARLSAGAHARVSADAFPADTFGATVTRIGPAVDPTQGSVEVRLTVPEPPHYLLPDMTVSVNLDAGYQAAAQVLPLEAVRGLGTDSPWVAVIRDGRLERRDVELGLLGDAFVQVLAGVQLGEPVVVGAETLAPGARVRARS